MSLFRQFEKIAKAQPQTVAVIAENNVLTFTNLLEMVDLFEINLLRRLPATGNIRIAMASEKLEFYLVMMLVASRNSYTMIFTTPDALQRCGVEYDHVLSEFEPAGTRPGELIRIDPSWLQPQERDTTIAYRPIEGDAVFCTTTSGSTGQPMIYPVEEDAFVAALDIGGGRTLCYRPFRRTYLLLHRCRSALVTQQRFSGNAAGRLSLYRRKFRRTPPSSI